MSFILFEYVIYNSRLHYLHAHTYNKPFKTFTKSINHFIDKLLSKTHIFLYDMCVRRLNIPANLFARYIIHYREKFQQNLQVNKIYSEDINLCTRVYSLGGIII